jgi:hypothetical protein
MTGSPLRASSHTKLEVRKVLEGLVDDGWVLCKEGHWGKLYCPCSPNCTRITVPGTPKNPSVAARRIAREAARCPLPVGDPRRP